MDLIHEIIKPENRSFTLNKLIFLSIIRVSCFAVELKYETSFEFLNNENTQCTFYRTTFIDESSYVG